jgi:hypothetical protein
MQEEQKTIEAQIQAEQTQRREGEQRTQAMNMTPNRPASEDGSAMDPKGECSEPLAF